jgi:hypothetical protein
MIKLKWVSNEKELGSFIQIRNIEEKKEYFITKGKNDLKYTLTIVNDNTKKYFNTIEEAKLYSEEDFSKWYLSQPIKYK